MLDHLEDEAFIRQMDIYITPPNDGNTSDQDSDTEEGTNVENLPAALLNATAEFRADYGHEIVDSLAEPHDDEDHELVESVPVTSVLLSPEMFAKCKNFIRPVKNALQCLQSQQGSRSDEQFLEDSISALLDIGNVIENSFDEEVTRSHLWTFASKFTEYGPVKLHKLYENVCAKRAAEIAEKNQAEATTTDTTITEGTVTTKTTTASTTHSDTHFEITTPSLQGNVENPPNVTSVSSKNSDAGATTRGRKRKVGGYVSPGDDENGHSTDNDSGTTDDEEEGVDDGFEENGKKYLSSVAPPKTEFKWRKRDIAVSKNTFKNPPSLSSFNSSTTPVRLFNLFFDDEVISLLVKMTNSYARMEKGNVKYETNENEMRLFLAILLRSGYASMPRRCMYWEGREDVANSFVPNAMARNRFDLLMQYLHFSSPSDQNDDDKMWKIRSFYKLINERCLHYAMYASDLSIDESMIPYFGRHNSKQRIANKPIRVGFKMWVLAESTGYVINFDPYEGAKGKAPTRSSPTTWG